MQQNDLYKNICIENINDLWDSLENKMEKLKLGEKLKYIKYLIIKDPPPKIEEKKNLIIYFKKILNIEEENEINQMMESLDNLFLFNDEQFEEQCEEWELSIENILKLKISIEIIKQNSKNKLDFGKNNTKEIKNKIESNTLKDEKQINKLFHI